MFMHFNIKADIESIPRKVKIHELKTASTEIRVFLQQH